MTNLELTEREIEGLKLVAAGLNVMEMCDTLFLTRITVIRDRQHIMEKLGATNMSHAMALAFRKGIIR